MSQITKLVWWHDSHPAIRGSILEPASSETIVVEATTTEGIRGYGYALHWRRDHALATAALVDALRSDVVGAPSDRPRDRWYRIERAHTRLLGLGSARFAQSAVDLALWDVHCQTLGKSLSGLVGGAAGRLETYASHDLWIGLGPAELLENARRHRADGFTRVKMRVGSGDVGLERERVAAVREGIGPDGDVMVDAAQRFNVPTAIAIGRMLEDFNVFWFEDPVYREDLDGLRRVGAAVGVRIATGENCFTLPEFRRLFDLGVASYILIDLQHVGGITGWYQVAALAEAYDLPVTTHVFPHLGAQLMLSTPNGYLAEYQPRWNHLFGEVTKEGRLIADPRPGIGLRPLVRPEHVSGD